MKKVLSSYIIQRNTIGLIPVRRSDYNTIVLTTIGKLYVKLTPYEIIDNSCLLDAASYKGKEEAVKRLTTFKNKVPIPINIVHGIYCFPTTSPLKDDCIWLFYNHIKEFEKNIKYRTLEGKPKSTVHFMNGTSLELDVSYYTLNQQYYRTAVCKSIFDNQKRVD